MGSIGDCCCEPECDAICTAALAASYYDASITFNEFTKTIRLDKVTTVTCPNYDGYLCWSTVSTKVDECVVEQEPYAGDQTIPCDYCTSTSTSEPDAPVSSQTQTHRGKPAWTKIITSTHAKLSIARWDKVSYVIQIYLYFITGLKYQLAVTVEYRHFMRYTQANCLQYVYAILSYDACPDQICTDIFSFPPSSECVPPTTSDQTYTLGSWIGYGALTLPTHITPFNDDEASVTSNACIPQQASIAYCNAFAPVDPLTPNTVSVTDCICIIDPEFSDPNLYIWSCSASNHTVYTGEGCCLIFAVFDGNCPDGASVLYQRIDYLSAEIDCDDLCAAPIELTRIPVDGEADPPVNIPASTLSNPPCSPRVAGSYGVLDVCTLDMDRPLIAKPAKIYVDLCP